MKIANLYFFQKGVSIFLSLYSNTDKRNIILSAERALKTSSPLNVCNRFFWSLANPKSSDTWKVTNIAK